MKHHGGLTAPPWVQPTPCEAFTLSLTSRFTGRGAMPYVQASALVQTPRRAILGRSLWYVQIQRVAGDRVRAGRRSALRDVPGRPNLPSRRWQLAAWPGCVGTGIRSYASRPRRLAAPRYHGDLRHRRTGKRRASGQGGGGKSVGVTQLRYVIRPTQRTVTIRFAILDESPSVAQLEMARGSRK